MQNCQREAARCRQQPILSVDVKYGVLRQDEWSQLHFSVSNIGFGPARNVIIHAEGDQFEGQVMATRSITTLPVGRSQIDQLDVRPRAVGRVPLRLTVEYTDRAGAMQSFKHALYVDVTPFAAGTARSGGIDINAQNVTVYGDVIGRDKTSAADKEAEGPREGPSAPLSSEVVASLQRQLREARENLHLIEERKAEYVLETDVPLQIIKEERRLQTRIADLEAQLGLGGLRLDAVPPAASAPAAGKAGVDDQPLPKRSWDDATLRQLLNAAFSDEELTTLCFDYFRPVYETFGTGTSKSRKIQNLIEHCERNLDVERLLDVIQSLNPRQFTLFESHLRGSQ
jgi:hypothetical protein